MNRLKRLTGQMGLSPANCRRVMSACVQSVAMFGAELWWKGGNVRGTTGRAEELQLLVNREARATTGAFRTTNLGALSIESGLRPATNQLENRQRRFGLRLLGLPQGEKAREMGSSNTPLPGQETILLSGLHLDRNRTDSAARGTRVLQYRTNPGRTGGDEEVGGKGETGTHHVHGWVTAGE